MSRLCQGNIVTMGNYLDYHGDHKLHRILKLMLMKRKFVSKARLESLKTTGIPDKNEFVKSGLEFSEKIINSSEKIITKVIDKANAVEDDCRIKADELFSLFTADVIKKDVVFYK